MLRVMAIVVGCAFTAGFDVFAVVAHSGGITSSSLRSWEAHRSVVASNQPCDVQWQVGMEREAFEELNHLGVCLPDSGTAHHRVAWYRLGKAVICVEYLKRGSKDYVRSVRPANINLPWLIGTH